MTKEEVQSRVSFNDLSLPLEDFDWDKKARVFSSKINGLMLDFKDVNGVTFNTGDDCMFKTGNDCTFTTDSGCTFTTGSGCKFTTNNGCTFNTGNDCKFNTDWNCTFKTGSGCKFKTSNNCRFNTGDNCTFDTGYTCTFDTDSHCTFKTSSDCTFNTDWNCTFDTDNWCVFNTDSNCKFDTGSKCTFKTNNSCKFDTSDDCAFTTGGNCTFDTNWGCVFDTGSNCTFDTGNRCTFKTSSYCRFNTGDDCTFDTGYTCTFDTDSHCAFDTGKQCVIIRRDIYEVISNKKEIQLCPSGISGYLEKIDDTWYLNSDVSLGEHILTDKILSKVISKKKINDGTLYRVYNYTVKGISETLSYLIEIDGIYAHGSSIRDAKDSIVYKMVDRDTSAYADMTLDTTYTIPEAIKMYRTITGACSEGVKMFVENTDNVPDTVTVQDILNITSGQYGHDVLKEYMDKTI
jgi:hypothetical protein